MTKDELWRTIADPNAETQDVRSADPDAPLTPGLEGLRQPGAGPTELTEPAVRVEPAEPVGFDEPGENGADAAPGRLQWPQWSQRPQWSQLYPGRMPALGRLPRRTVLYAAGGVMLLAGCGAALATQARGATADPTAADADPSGHPSHGPSSPTAHANTPHPPSPTRPPSERASAGTQPRMNVPTAPQWYVEDHGPTAIALTLDDGPHPIYTPQVLEILRRHGVKATFNMIGSQVAANLPLVREVSAEGHTITNHTWNHADLSTLPVSQILSQIDRCNDALANANQHPTIFRAPYGNWSHAVFEACAERNLQPVGWSVDPRDWDTEHVTTAQIVANVMSHTRPHDIILEHDGGGDRSNTVAALKIFIPRLLERGLKFVAM